MASNPGAHVKLTYADYVLFPDDGKRHEIIDGVHHVSASSNLYHQRVSRRIQFQLYRQVEETGRGEVFDAPTDVVLTDVDVVVPDLMVVMNERSSILGDKYVGGAPDLVVEILSSGSDRRDRVLKAKLYAREGVPEYWIVDPERHAVEQQVLADGEYRLVATCSDAIAPLRIGDVQVDLARVWERRTH
jgi:Uma2 family endonuclease